MSIFKKKTSVKKEIIELLEAMKKVSHDSDEYTAMAKNLETICSANEKNSKNKLSLLGTMLGVGGSLLGIVMVIYGEETRILTSKALGLVLKSRV